MLNNERSTPRTPLALYALAAGGFGIGTTEFVIMGLLQQVATDLRVSITAAGLLISGYALGVFVGAPVLTVATSRLPRKVALVALMVIFTLGNLACAVVPSYGWLMAARVLTSLAHGTFFGVGAVVATSLVPPERRASAISIMMTGLTVATLLGVPAGAWLGLRFGWRATFWAVAAVGVAATLIVSKWVPHDVGAQRVHFADELRAISRPQVVLGLLITVLGFGGLFAAYTYIQPILMELAGFKEREISPILLVFGVGMIVGNLLGGRWADRRLNASLLGTLAALASALGLMNVAMHSRLTAVLFIGLLGGVAFATSSPLQMRVLQQTQGAGQNLASSFNIAAFNLGNAVGAWLGGLVIARGLGLTSVSWVGMLMTVSGLLVALGSLWLEGRQRRAKPALVICSEGQA